MGDVLPVTEGYLPFAGYRTWYRVTGESEEPGKLPLLCLHGGPGATWHHMEPYQELAAQGRRVICYDQLGCGNSAVSEPHDASMWDDRAVPGRAGRGSQAPRPGSLSCARSFVGRHARHGLRGHQAGRAGQPAGRVLARQRVCSSG